MITIMNSLNKPMMNETDNGLDSQLWHSCAGGLVQMPPVNSKVFYFPQGHAEHANGTFHFGNFPRIPALILCRVSATQYLADTETDEVYAKIRLVPLRINDCNSEDDDYDDGFLGMNEIENQEKPTSFAKTLTQSDANNGGGFSVPRYCAETIFPRLDYTAEPPVQKILAKDVHGEIWQFRHIYRGTPRRHLLTTGWSNFVNRKKLVAGDSIVFLRADNGDLCVGIRRAKSGIGGGPEAPSGWNTMATNYVSAFLKEDENKKLVRNGSCNGGLKGKGRVRDESVIEAANLAASRQPFEVVYYPHASTPEFFVKASSVRAAIRIQWCLGMRFKMAFETEDSSRISWFMGTISDVHVDDPVRWPNSPWRLLQVAWDEPDLLKNVKRVNPWLVELVSNMPTRHLSPFSPPRKKMRLPQPPDFPLLGQFPMTSLFSNPLLGPNTPLRYIPDNIPAGIQGARHAQFQSSSSSSSLDLHFKNLHSAFNPVGTFMDSPESNETISCLLTIGNHTQSPKKNIEVKKPVFLLFGQPILTEDQMSQSCTYSWQ